MEMKMKKLSSAIALAIVLPFVAHAQAAPSARTKEACCAKMNAQGKTCCCDDPAQGHDAEHAMKGMDTTRK
jgi:hypothetical protein